jgi:hypothetical protein
MYGAITDRAAAEQWIAMFDGLTAVGRDMRFRLT